MASLHHVELCTSQAGRLLRLFTAGLGFRRLGGRITPRCLQWVVNSGRATFVITQRHRQVAADAPANPLFTHGEPWTQFCCGRQHARDSVFNVALRVRDVRAAAERAARAGGRLLQPAVRVSDALGSVQYAVVGSVCGNVVHTLVNRDGYRGAFLPQFLDTPPPPHDESGACAETAAESGRGGDRDGRGGHRTDFVDHVTLTCRRGESGALVDWYRRVFGMRRFRLNSQDCPEDGVRFEGEVGMALKAMEYWRCAETGVSAPPADGASPTLKFVIAESLCDSSHVETFNRQHGGSGVQHIGLHTDNIVPRVAEMRRRGVVFRRPPRTYYTQTGKGDEIRRVGIHGDELKSFQRLGLLLDSEADEDSSSGDKYLMQVFSEPLFAEETFFMEVLERRGARGFGQGNIAALARSIVEDERQRRSG